MTSNTYVRYEVLRNFRNWRFALFAMVYPLAIYLLVTAPQRHAVFDGVKFPVYFMTAMATMGTIIAVVSVGTRIAVERSTGWTRQMRTTPLRPAAYFTAKTLCAYLMAVLVIIVMCLAGAALGARLTPAHWLEVGGLLLVGIVPFVLIGLALGHLLPADALLIGTGGTVIVFCLLGGAYGFLIAKSGAMFEVIKALPSYWLVQAGKVGLGGHSWPAEAWIVLAIWTVVLVPITVFIYKRDTSRA